MDAPDGARTDGRVSGCWPSISEWEKSREGRGGGRRGREAVGRGRGRLGGALRPRIARTRKGRVGVREWEVTYHRFLVARMIRLVCGMANVHEGGRRPRGSVAKEWLESGRQRVHFVVRVACGSGCAVVRRHRHRRRGGRARAARALDCRVAPGRAGSVTQRCRGAHIAHVLENPIQFHMTMTRRTRNCEGDAHSINYTAIRCKRVPAYLAKNRSAPTSLPWEKERTWRGLHASDAVSRRRRIVGQTLHPSPSARGAAGGGAFDPP